MYIRKLSLVSLLPLVLAAPVPQEATTFSEPSVSSLPGVNITNGYIAQTKEVVKNSYIIVLKDNISPAAINTYQDKVSKRVGKGLKNKYRINPGQAGQKGLQAVQVTTDKKGLADIAKDPSVSSFPSLPRV